MAVGLLVSWIRQKRFHRKVRWKVNSHVDYAAVLDPLSYTWHHR